MFGQSKDNPKKLRVVKTARTKKAINKAAGKGFRPLIKSVDQGSSIFSNIAVYQHKTTGEIEVIGDFREKFDDEYECVLPFRCYYPYNFPNPFAAYLIPANLAEGEHVWLEDVIEDIVAVYRNQGCASRLKCAEAVWADGDFTILFKPERNARRLIG